MACNCQLTTRATLVQPAICSAIAIVFNFLIEYLESIGVPCCCQAALLDDLVKQGQGRLTEITREQYRGKPKNPCQSAAVAYGEAMTTEMLHKVSS